MIRITTFNTASTFGEDGKSDWRRSADELGRLAPETAGCEEVTVHELFEPDLDMPALFSSHLNMHVIFGRATSRDSRGDYGVMALSRHPLEEIGRIQFPTPPEAEKRICLITRICAPQPYYFLVTHLPYQGEFPDDGKARLQFLNMITEEVRSKKLFPAILCGDFNISYDSPELDVLRRDWTICNDMNPRAITHHSGKMLDYICVYPRNAARLHQFFIGEQTGASDHFPVTVDLEWQETP